MKNNTREVEHITHVNLFMDELYSLCSDIYESMADREFESCKKSSKELINKIKDLIQSIDDTEEGDRPRDKQKRTSDKRVHKKV